ncbi:MAG: flagellar hook-basal body protein [Solimonas sp.]
MSSVADIAVAALQADQDRLRVIGQNLSNTSTPGYRAEIPFLDPGVRFDAYVDRETAGSLSAPSRTLRSERPGVLQQTDRKLDLALEGAGYFQLMTADGAAYSRRGDFHIDQNGMLRGPRDLPVLGVSGPITLPDADVTVKADGTIEKDGLTIAKFALAQFSNSAQLEYAGDGVFMSSEGPQAVDDQGLRVRQGYVEASNVQAMTEMTRMMEISRHFGASAQALKAYDQMLDSALTGL